MSAPIDEARLAEIEARANAATPGPWRAGTVEAEGKVWAHDPTALGGPSLGERCVFSANPHYPHNANRAFIAAARTDVPALVAEVRRLTAALATVTAERDRLQRACDEGLPREYIECPACHAQHIEGPRHDNPALDGRTRPHHTHRCYHCGHVWDAGRWSFGADVPKPAPESAALATARREGAEEMRERAAQACEGVAARQRTSTYVPETSAKWSVGIADGADVCATYVRALPLDAPGGAT